MRDHIGKGYTLQNPIINEYPLSRRCQCVLADESQDKFQETSLHEGH